MKNNLIKYVISTFCILFCIDSYAFDPKTRLHQIFTNCIEVGYVACDKEFLGTNRGSFHTIIAVDRLLLIENEFDQYMKKSDGREEKYFSPYLFDGILKLKMKLSKTYTLLNFEKVIDEIKKVNNRYIVKIKGADSFELVNENNIWKIRVTDNEERNFMDSSGYPWFLVIYLKANILSYHMEYAKYNNQNKKDMLNDINVAFLPLLWNSLKEEEKTLVKKWLIKNPEEVFRFYKDLNTEKAIRTQVKAVSRSKFK